MIWQNRQATRLRHPGVASPALAICAPERRKMTNFQPLPPHELQGFCVSCAAVVMVPIFLTMTLHRCAVIV